jgi:integrase
VGTGLRRGELLGLRWPDVDFDRRSVNVNWELQRHRGRGLVFVEPKTDRARREVRLSYALVAMLEQVRTEQDERRSVLGPVWQEHGVLFDAGDGRPIDPDYFTEACKRTFKAVGMPDAMRLHDLRHAFGSLLFAAGVHPKVASAALGHASEAFTMSVYQHMFDGMGDRVAEVISEALPGLGVNRARSTPADASEPAREGANRLPRKGSENDTSLGKDGADGQVAAL